MNFKDGSSTLPTILLMVLITGIAAFGFILLTGAMDTQVAEVTNDTDNFTGINYTTELGNTTINTVHGLSAIMPNLIYFVLIFLAVAFIALLAVALKHR